MNAPHSFGVLPEEWKRILPESSVRLAEKLTERANSLRNMGEEIYPSKDNVFRSLWLTKPDNVKVVIVGQDPYHEPEQAIGLAFSVGNGVKLPPSLRNIFKELESDLGIPTPKNGDLSGWAKQGVLLLNTVLTVERGKANSHKDWGWQELTGSIVSACDGLSQPIVFLLWGNPARNFCKVGETGRSDRCLLCSSHPSPLSAYHKSGEYPAFLGSRPFSAVNERLVSMGELAVDWSKTGEF